jgi:hypothetical protein
VDSSEKIVFDFLRSSGYTDIQYEPAGNVPPDFLVNGNIAVEVRRLNQNYELPDGNFYGLEEKFYPTWQKFEQLLLAFGPSLNEETWSVGFNYSNPPEPWSKIKPLILDKLNQFMQMEHRREGVFQLTDFFEIDFMKVGKQYNNFFIMGAASDNDSGGLVVGEIYRNLKICVAEKEPKIVPSRYKYPNWWFILVDYIGYGLSAEDRLQLDMLPKIEHNWSKIILVNPNSPHHAFEI